MRMAFLGLKLHLCSWLFIVVVALCRAEMSILGAPGVLCALDMPGDHTTASTCASDISGTIANQLAYDLRNQSHFKLYLDILRELNADDKTGVLSRFMSGRAVVSTFYEKQIYDDGYILRFLQLGYVCVRLDNRTASGRVVRRVQSPEDNFAQDEIAIFLDANGGAIPCGAPVVAPTSVGIFNTTNCNSASAHVAGCTLRFAKCVDEWEPPRIAVESTALENVAELDRALDRTLNLRSVRVANTLNLLVKPTVVNRMTNASRSAEQAGLPLHSLRAHADFEARNEREAPLPVDQAALLLFLPALLSGIFELATIVDLYRHGARRSSNALLTIVVLIVAVLTMYGIAIELRKTTHKYEPIAVHGKSTEAIELVKGRVLFIDTYSVVVLEARENGLAGNIIIASLIFDGLDILACILVLASLFVTWIKQYRQTKPSLRYLEQPRVGV